MGQDQSTGENNFTIGDHAIGERSNINWEMLSICEICGHVVFLNWKNEWNIWHTRCTKVDMRLSYDEYCKHKL